MQAATTEANPNILQNLISNLLATVHAEESELTFGPPELWMELFPDLH